MFLGFPSELQISLRLLGFRLRNHTAKKPLIRVDPGFFLVRGSSARSFTSFPQDTRGSWIMAPGFPGFPRKLDVCSRAQHLASVKSDW